MKQPVIVQLLVCFLLVGLHTSYATEGASSYYFPGSSTTFGVALPPAPGFMFANQMLFYNGIASKAVLGGNINLGLEAKAFYNYIGGFYTFEKSVLGCQLQLGAVASVGHANLNVNVGPYSISDNKTDIGDSVISAALYWKKGDLHYKLIESVTAPTGGYSTGGLANIGRNYWGFDTSLAITWLNMKTGTEISVTPGIMLNTKNSSTDYKSGSEFHVDFAVNQYLSQSLAVGFQGYYYHQVSGDSGSGAKLGSFKGESFGVGPAVMWTPKAAKGNLSFVGKWLHDVNETNRLHGDYGQLTAIYKWLIVK